MIPKIENGFILTPDKEVGYVLLEFVDGEVVDIIPIEADSVEEAMEKSKNLLGNSELEIEYNENYQETDEEDFNDDFDYDFEEEPLDQEEDEEGELEEDESMTPEEKEGWESLAEYYSDPSHSPD